MGRPIQETKDSTIEGMAKPRQEEADEQSTAQCSEDAHSIATTVYDCNGWALPADFGVTTTMRSE